MINRNAVQYLVDLSMAFGRVNRATLHPDGTPESDATHTVMLQLVAGAVAGAFGLNPLITIQFALIHDLVEFKHGDISTLRPLGPEAAAQKRAQEAEALAEIRENAPPLAALIDLYEAQTIPEARLVRLVDKILPKLTHARNGALAAKEAGVDFREFVGLHTDQMRLLKQQYPEFPPLHDLLAWACSQAEMAYATTGETSWDEQPASVEIEKKG